MQLCDIGVNLTNNRYLDDWQETVHTAAAVGVSKLIITGTNMQESKDALTQAHTLPEHLYATVGIHPHYAKEAIDGLGKPQFVEQMRQMLSDNKAVAVGECGLDFNRNFSPKTAQLAVFEAQLEIACECKLPVFLHERDAFDEQIRLLEAYRPHLVGGVAHCFTGNTEQMQAYLALGLYIGITGWLCDPKRGQALRDAVSHLPVERLLLETDAPYLMPKTLKANSKRNDPANLPYILQEVASLLPANLSTEQVANISYQNSLSLFNLE
ncbi:TatD family hydrolase [Alteromonas sp. a30]|uniref:TatD family hydrolase n=1 Tax=Alteromonas sp. a30 TaxID=2730917 RepID=UPI00227FA631|nr:TatD family hydrolase [Alteromonas sp. a30]MCY7295359.1 hydrolase TatD [Alteromonas sp. a30]